MKYHRLNADELAVLEPEFIKFLIVNGIDGADWTRIKANDTAHADELLDVFSDMILEGTLKNISFLDVVLHKVIYAFQCEETNITLHALELVGDGDFTFRNNFSVTTLSELLDAQLIEVKAFTQQKPYQPDRNTELYKMIQNGMSISNGEWFMAIEKILK